MEIYSLKWINKKETIKYHLFGQAKILMTSFLFILSPNLSLNNKPSIHDPNKRTFDKSKENFN